MGSMPVLIQQLSVGDEVQVYMKLGLAISLRVTAKGKLYYQVPDKPHRARAGDLTRFIGFVLKNNPEQKVITVQVTPFNSWQQAAPTDSVSKTVDLSYTSIQRMRRYSKYAHTQRTQIKGSVGSKDIRRPGSVASFGGTDLRPYRTLEEVILYEV